MSEIAENHIEERRVAPRTRALKKGVIAFKDRYCSTECMIRNESEDGALLMVSQNQVIPNTFELKVYPDRDFRIAEAIWRTPDAMGIRYVQQKTTQVNDRPEWDGVERRAPRDRRQQGG